MMRYSLRVAIACLLVEPCAVVGQTTSGTSATIVVPVIAQTSSFGSEVTVFNPNAASINVNTVFYDAQNTASPGPKACASLSIGANVSKGFTVASQCALPSGSNFGLLVLTESTGTNRFYGYARTQTPQGIGFSTEGFPIENFNDQVQHATGLKRVAASGGLPAYQTNCFVATLGDAVNYELRLFDGSTNTQLGSTLSGSLGAFQQLRYLDVFAAAGVAAGNKANVRAQFTNLIGNKKKLIGFCTVQENTNLSADFRIAKSFGGTPQNAFVQGGNAFGTKALIGTTDNQPLTALVNGAPALRLAPASKANGNASINVIGGFTGNVIDPGVIGATIAGGGFTRASDNAIFGNHVESDFGTVSGGNGNAVYDFGGTISGGEGNLAGRLGVVGGGASNTAGNNNVGGDEGATVAGGEDNAASGFASFVGGGENNAASGSFSAIVAGALNTSSGEYSTVVGGQNNLAFGTGSVAMGQFAKANFHGCLVFGDNSTLNDVRCDDDNRVVFRAVGGIFMFTGGNTQATYTGVALAPGGGAWVTVSDRATKEHLASVDATQILAKVVALPIATWNWKTQDPAIRHMGPMGQDFRAAFGLGETEKGISTVDADGVALAAIQGLYQLVQEKDAQMHVQQREIEDLREELDALKRAVGHLTASDARAVAGR